MRICFLAAANSIHSVRWVKYFYEKGHEISWISLAPPIPEAKDLISKVKYFEITPSPLADINGKKSIFYLLPAASKVKKILQDLKPDILHIHSAGTYGLVGALTNFKPIVLTPWGSDILLMSSIKKLLIKFVLKRTTLFTCDGENTTQTLINFGVKPEKIKMIRFGTDVEKFCPNPKLKAKSSKLKAISLRNLEPVYDIETLIKAAVIVIKEFPGVEFKIIGDGSQKEYLKELVTTLEIEKNIKFLGKIQNQFLPEYLQSADIYVSTSLSDSGLSASTAEAMASGLPVIVSDSGDNKQWVSPPGGGKGGFVIPLKSPDVLAEKIIYLLKNKNLLKSFGEYNRKIIEEKNNYYKEMDKMEKLYQELVNRN